MSEKGTQKEAKNEDTRALRGEYLKLDRALEDNRDEIAEVVEDGGVDRFEETLNAMEGLRQGVHRPREFQADTRVYAKVVQIGVDKARRLIQSASKETAGHLVTALGALFLNEDHQDRDGYIAADAFDWVSLGDKVAHLFCPGAGVGGLLGPMEVQPKEAKARAAVQRRVKEPDAPIVRVTQAENLDEREKQETDRNMSTMIKVLTKRSKEGHATRMLDLILNHTSFAQTIENIFALSFLVKDGRVSIRESENGLVVALVQKAEGPGAPATGSAMQFVVCIDMKDWAALKEHARPEDCLMPNRDGYQGRARIVMPEVERAGAGAGPSGAAPTPRAAAEAPAEGAGAGPSSAFREAGTGRKKRPLDAEVNGTDDSPPEQVKFMDSTVRIGGHKMRKVLVASPLKMAVV